MAKNQKTKTKASLAELVAEKPIAEDDNSQVADLEYVDKHAMPKSKLPEYYQSICSQMAQLDELQKTIDAMAAEKTGHANYVAVFLRGLKRSVLPVQRSETIDELIESEIAVMHALGADTRKAIHNINLEASRLRKYADYAMGEFDSAKGNLLTANSKYAASRERVARLETSVTALPMMDAEFTGKKMEYDNERRELSRLNNRRYVYAARTKFRIMERRAVIEREEAVRNVLYELQKMSDATTMFLQSIQQTHSTTTVLQMAYKTGDALHVAYGKLSDIAKASGLIAIASVQRFTGIAEQASYDFPHEQLEAGKRQKTESAIGQKTDLIAEVLDLLSKPIIETVTPASRTNGYGGSYEAQKQLLETLG